MITDRVFRLLVGTVGVVVIVSMFVLVFTVHRDRVSDFLGGWAAGMASVLVVFAVRRYGG